MHNTIE